MQYPTGSGMKNGELVAAKLVGVNRQARGAEGTFSDCRNIMPDKYPCISTYAGYEDFITEYTNIQCAIAPMYGATKFCGVADGKFYWDGEEKEHIPFSHYTISADSEIECYVINGFIYLREKKTNGKLVLYRYDIYKRHDWGATHNDRIFIPYQVMGGEEIKWSVIPPVSGGDQWYKYYIRGPEGFESRRQDIKFVLGMEDEEEVIKLTENVGLLTEMDAYYILMGGWSDFYNCYTGIRILNKNGEVNDPREVNSNGNRIYPDGKPNTLNSGMQVALYTNITPKSVPFEIYKNRVWAGRDDGGAIYATSLASGEDYWDFQGLASDSVEIEIGSQDSFVGFKAYSDSLLCFKRNSITVLYGDTPDNFSIGKEIKGTGCIDIRSCEIIDGVLYFLGSDGFYSYSGGWPQLISNDLNTRYISCISFSFEGKYYAEGLREDGEKEIAVYDTRRGMWLLEEAQGIRGVYYKDSDVYIVTENAVKRRKASKEYEACDDEWYFESMDLYEGIFEKKGISELFIRARLSQGAEMTVLTRDEDGELTEHKTFTGNGRLETYRVPVRFSKKEAYRYRIEGKGPAVIYEVARTVALGGRKIYEE